MAESMKTDSMLWFLLKSVLEVVIGEAGNSKEGKRQALQGKRMAGRIWRESKEGGNFVYSELRRATGVTIS
jgi:hypothetical protein